MSTHEGRHLRGRTKRDTQPEVRLRRALHAQGLRFRLQVRLEKGCTPDVLLPRHRLAIFVDGCFWHGCPVHGRSSFSGPNADLWLQKFQRNAARDRAATERARSHGYEVLRYWECAVNDDLDGVVTDVLSRVPPR